MEITLASSPVVNIYMSDRINVAEYHALYINFRKLVEAKKTRKDLYEKCVIYIQMHCEELKIYQPHYHLRNIITHTGVHGFFYLLISSWHLNTAFTVAIIAPDSIIC